MKVVVNFKFDSYQDMRRNLVLLTSGTLLLCALLAVWFVISDADRQSAVDAFNRLQGAEKGYPALALPIAIGLGWVLVEFLRITDFYDKIVVRWRASFDVDVIIARLYMPFAERVNPRFMDVAAANRRAFMNPMFYEFVRDRDSVIRRNLIVRFWERATLYWFGQMLEIFLLFSAGSVIAYRVLATLTSRDADRLFGTLCALGASLVLNRLFIRTARTRMRQATLEELSDIVENHRASLQEKVRQLAETYQVPQTLPAQA